MIVLDTNVISEPLKPRADPVVTQWLDEQNPEVLFLAATVLSEVLIGLALLPAGKRKHGMEQGMLALQTKLFEDRFLTFDREAAIAFALLGSRAVAKGYSISSPTAKSQPSRQSVDSRSPRATARHSCAAGIPVINPWKTELRTQNPSPASQGLPGS